MHLMRMTMYGMRIPHSERIHAGSMKMARLSDEYTNRSIRSTNITALDDAGFEARHIMRITGHKNESSIRSYSHRLSIKKKRDISAALSESIEVEKENRPPPIQQKVSLFSKCQCIPSLESCIQLCEPQPSTSKCQVPPQPYLPVVHSNANASAVNIPSTCNSFTEYVSTFDDISDGELLNVENLDVPHNVDLIQKNVDLPQNVQNTVGAPHHP